MVSSSNFGLKKTFRLEVKILKQNLEISIGHTFSDPNIIKLDSIFPYIQKKTLVILRFSNYCKEVLESRAKVFKIIKTWRNIYGVWTFSVPNLAYFCALRHPVFKTKAQGFATFQFNCNSIHKLSQRAISTVSELFRI